MSDKFSKAAVSSALAPGGPIAYKTPDVPSKAPATITPDGGGVQTPQANPAAVENAKKAATKTVTDPLTDVYHVDCRVFLEGIEVPYVSCAVSYGIDNPPSATITLPASAFMRDLPESTKVLIIFKDLIGDQDGNYLNRVLFDGELSGIQYSINSAGATISLTALHSSAYLTVMQLMVQAAHQYIQFPQPKYLGNMVLISDVAGTKVKTDMVKRVLEGQGFNSMADLVYILLRNILEGYKDQAGAASAKWYWSKVGNTTGGYKILDRIYGVSDTAKNQALLDPDISPAGSETSASKANTTATTGGSYGDLIIQNADRLKGSGYGYNGCVRAVSAVWKAAGLDFPNTAAVDDLVTWARSNGRYITSGSPPKGSIAVYNTRDDSGNIIYQGHVGVIDGAGSVYHNSTAKGHTLFKTNASIDSSWSIAGYVIPPTK